MRVWNTKRIWERPFFVYCRSHVCPQCAGKLERVKASRVVDPKSEEAKDFDFTSGDDHLIGKVRFVWTAFHCEACQRDYRVNELYQIEKQKK